eukprot:6182612-Pleurochrysis_carterae.AAC.3
MARATSSAELLRASALKCASARAESSSFTAGAAPAIVARISEVPPLNSTEPWGNRSTQRERRQEVGRTNRAHEEGVDEVVRREGQQRANAAAASGRWVWLRCAAPVQTCSAGQSTPAVTGIHACTMVE